MYNTGETPGKGKYECTVCGAIVELENDTDALPVCPVCGVETYEKVED